MKIIYLGKNNKQTKIDDEDYERINQYKWFCCKEGKTFYAMRSIMTSRKLGKRKCFHIRLHRFILNAPKDKQVDHINGNGLDNRKENLRLCTLKENTRNKGKSLTNTSGYKGVSYHKLNNKWIAHIGVNGVLRHLGYFKDKKETALAYNNAAKKYFGEFARLNIMKI